MKRMIGAMLLFFASASHAGHLDVIAFTLNEGCTMEKYLEIVDDFNDWAAAYGYQAEIAVPAFHANLATLYWLGRSANGETFGKAYDVWETALGDARSTPAQLNARFGECSTNVTRHAYTTFP